MAFFNVELGMAKPIPLPSSLLAVFMPITQDLNSDFNGPPLLPGLIAASVCIKLFCERARPDTMPLETDP